VLLVTAILVILIGGLFNFTDLGKYPIDITANTIAALIITYSILRHQLLDIKVVIRKSMLYTIPTVIISATYFLIINSTLFLFNADSQSKLIGVSLFLSILAALIVQPFRDHLQNWIDRYFFRERYNMVSMLQRVSETSSSVIEIDQLMHFILDEITSTMQIENAAAFLRNSSQKYYAINNQIGMAVSPRLKFAEDHPVVKKLDISDKVITRQELETDPIYLSLWREEKRTIENLHAEVFMPLKAGGDLVGLLILGPKLSEQSYGSEDKEILITLSHQTAVAVQNAQLYSKAQQELFHRRKTEKRLQLQLKRLSALQNINIAITTNIDLQIPLYLLLEQVTEELGVDAADVLLMDDENQQLVFVAGRGFRTDALKYTKLDIGQGLAGMAAEQSEVIHIQNILNEATSLRQSPMINSEQFISYFGVPLITKGKVKGVLELFHRSELEPTDDWMDFLDTLTSETAIAVDNAQLFRDLEKSNLDLAVAYETTLEGWARTLELRDRETEGHSQRVLELTTMLANKMGVSSDDLIHMQRGALLHDIGKMGVPDQILLKEGPLTDEEWEIMRKHPVFAYDMLSSIPFLEKAIDIPYNHHEKWDGSGYPRGLAGEEIPLSARIFAVVDVWDALRSDRPYRKAWSDVEALRYIEKEKGKHFDPAVVDTFNIVVKNEKRKKIIKFK